jgi:hypothetical protein
MAIVVSVRMGLGISPCVGSHEADTLQLRTRLTAVRTAPLWGGNEDIATPRGRGAAMELDFTIYVATESAERWSRVAPGH